MKIFKIWSAWKDIEVRKDYKGNHYLLQMRVSDRNDKKFRNIRIDNSLYHGNQNISESILK